MATNPEANQLPVGPYQMVAIDNDVHAPFYMIPFDEQGRCQGPLTQNQLLSTAQNGAFTDVFLFSHGWNSDWSVATSTYNAFLQGYMQSRKQHGLSYPRSFQPLLVGIFWPSVALVMPWESAPAIAGLSDVDPQLTDLRVAQERHEVQSIASAIANEDVERFYTLAQQRGLSQDEALELAKILSPFYLVSSDDLPITTAPPSSEEIVKLWRDALHPASSTNTSGEFGFADDSSALPKAAGDFSMLLDPRSIIRLCTIFQMKDRAGVVGAHGVCDLLHSLLSANASLRLHLIGHSFGCKVVLSALCYRDLPRPVHSLLLLQPAISCLCFAKDATGTGQPGGYHDALQRVELPILSTFSSQDAPLHNFFQLAVRRASDMGELHIAGGPPDRYAALGGYGPFGCEEDCKIIPIKSLGDPYDFGPGAPKIYGLNGGDVIHNHGDFDNDQVWWALFEQVVN